MGEDGDTSGLDGAPDVGTLGGTLSDQYGENSVTTGGDLSQVQSDANNGVNADPWGYDFNAAGFTEPGAWGLGDLFGYNAPTGLPTMEGGPYGGNVSGYGLSDFASSPFSKALRSLMGMTPFGKVANIGIDAMQNKPAAQIAANALPGMYGTVAKAGLRAANSSNPAASLGRDALGFGLGTLGQNVGYSFGGPVGALAGGMLGSKAAGMTGGPARGGSSGNMGAGGGGDLFTSLADLYGNYRGYQNAQQLQDNANTNNAALQGQMGTLANMYTPDSAYAKQLAQQLARKDAASGRNSQYGNRAVELQARLAALAPTVSNSMATLGGQMNTNYTNSAAANKQSQIAQAQMLKQLLGLGEATGFNSWAKDGLSNLFSSNEPEAPVYYDDPGPQWT